jgi:lambda family phage tail tape measure protein
MANETSVRVTADASGYTAELDRARKSADAFAVTQAQAAQRIATAQKAIAEAATNGSNVSARAINNFVSQLARTADQAGKTRAELLQMKAAQLGIADSVSGYVSQIESASKATHEFSLNSSGARRELLVLAHEASQGNWTRFAGSLGVLGERTDALGAIMSTTGVGIGLFAAALAAAAVDIYKVTSAIAELDKASTVTNGYLGLTNDQLSTMAQQLAGANGGLVETSATMAALIRTGHASAASLAELTGVVTQFGKDAGMSADKAAEAFVKMLDDPKKGMEDLQAQYHMFSAAQVSVIDGYIQTGDTAKATQAFIDAVAESQHRMATQGQEEVGLLTRLWLSFSDAAKQAGDNFDRMGVEATNAEKLTDALTRQSAAQRNLQQAKAMPFGNTLSAQSELDAANAQVAALQKVQEAQKKAADENAARAKSGDAKIAVDSYLSSSQYATPQRQHSQQLDAENASFAKATANLDKASADYQSALKRHYENVEQINAEYSKKTRVHGDSSAFNGQIASMTAANQLIEAEEKRHEQQLKASRSLGLVDSETYLTQLAAIQERALDQEIGNAQKRVDIAKAKPESAAYQDALKDLQKLQGQRLDLEEGLTTSLAQLQQKRAEDVQRYAIQAAKPGQQQGAAYSAQDATRYSTPQDAAAYTAKLQLAQQYAQNVTALWEKYALDPASDQKAFQQKMQWQQDYYADQMEQLDAHLAQEQERRNSYSDQMHLAVTELGGDGQTNAQMVSTAFTSAWQDASNALDTFIATGKGNFDTFTAGILADLAKIALHQAEMQLFQGIGASFFSTGGSVGSYATGGAIVGAGTGTSDSIPAMLSNGEFVVKASQAKKYGSLLESINSGGVSLVRVLRPLAAA